MPIPDAKPPLHSYPYPRPAVAADAALFTVHEEQLKVLLIRRGHPPHEGAWAIPGGFVDVGDEIGAQGEDLEAAALRELEEETNLPAAGLRLEQIAAFGRPDRDPRARVITVVFVDLVQATLVGQERAGDDAAHASWREFGAALRSKLAFDHREVLRRAHEQIRVRLRDSPIADRSLPASFTSAELRRCYTVIDPSYADASHFRRIRAGLEASDVLQRVEPSASRARYRFRRARRAGPHLY